MGYEIKSIVTEIISHPKTSLTIAGLANLNVWWADYGEPIAKIITSVLGIVLVSMLIIKHAIDICHTIKREKLNRNRRAEDNQEIEGK